MTAVQALFFDLNEILLDGSGEHDAILRACRSIAAATPDLDADMYAPARMRAGRAADAFDRRQ